VERRMINGVPESAKKLQGAKYSATRRVAILASFESWPFVSNKEWLSHRAGILRFHRSWEITEDSVGERKFANYFQLVLQLFIGCCCASEDWTPIETNMRSAKREMPHQCALLERPSSPLFVYGRTRALAFELKVKTNASTNTISRIPPSTQPRMIQRVLQEEESTLKTATREARVPSSESLVDEVTLRHDLALLEEATETAKFVVQFED
jgi:hypothetical protein